MQFGYKITEFDEENKRLRVDFYNGQWAMIPMSIPLPTSKAQIDELVKQYTDSQVRVNSIQQPADLNFIHKLVGVDLIAERLRAKGGEIDQEPVAVATLPLIERQSRMWHRIKKERDYRKFNGVKIGETWFYTDADTRAQFSILDAKAMRESWRSTVVLDANWKTMSPMAIPVYVSMTVGLMRQIVDACIVMEKANYANCERHRVQLLLAEDPDAYDFSGGWEATYQW